MIGLTVSQKDPNLLGAMKAGAGTAAASPFVVVCKTMGVKVLPHIINGVVVTSALSSGNEQIYALSRILMAMARNRLMPQLFLRTTKRGVPWPGVIVACLFGCLAFLSVSNGSNQAFTWLTNLSALSSLFTWIFICISYVRFKKALDVQGIDRKKLVLTGYFQPVLAWVCIVWFSIILLLNGFASFMPKWNASGEYKGVRTRHVSLTLSRLLRLVHHHPHHYPLVLHLEAHQAHQGGALRRDRPLRRSP